MVGWYFRSLELWRPLRVLVLLFATLILADPAVPRKQHGMDLWVLVDRSTSAREVVDRGVVEWRKLLEKARPGRMDRLLFVNYAEEVVADRGGETANYSGGRNLTRTALALQDVLARVDRKRHSRLLLFSDGFSTEPLTEVAEKLTAMGAPLDYRLLRGDEVTDYRIANFEMPNRAQLGEPVILELTVLGTPDGSVPLEIFRGEKRLTEMNAEVKGGVGRVRLSDRILTPGAHSYSARITPAVDAFAGNNRYENWIEIVSGPRILLATNYDDDAMAPVLKAQGFDVRAVTDPLSLEPGMLSGARAVIFNNVPAYEIPNSFLSALDFFVREQGGGFMMAGGKYSFGSGGYYESAVDSLLPVSMELKSEHRKLAVAMAIVMDRSGSMSMTVNSGHSKMQLANEGAARAIELLGAGDAVTVYAVDSSAHQIAPLLNVGKHRHELVRRVRSIESLGGGIFVYVGLKEAWNSLKKSDLGQRHVILFSDAQDSEEPGNYKSLLAEMTRQGATVSVIGLGNRSDVDAPLLEDIAKRGEGRIFFTNVPGDLPNIFAQETVTVARSSFIDNPVGTQATGNWFTLSNRDLPWLKQVDGYNLSYLREGDEAALVSTDEYAAPLVAFGRRGIGRTAAVSFPLGGEFSSLLRNWNKAGDFMQTLTRWLMGEDIPPGIGLRYDLTGTELSVDLLFDSELWKEKFAVRPPAIKLSRGRDNPSTSDLTWERIAPGHYSVRTDLREGELIRGAARAGNAAIPFGPLIVGSGREWAFDSERVQELRQTSQVSGGRELLELADAWLKPEGRELASIQSWLLIPLVLLFLLEALVTRTGWKFPVMSNQAGKRVRAEKAASPKPVVVTPKPEDSEVAVVKKEEERDSVSEDLAPADDAARRQSRFARAKKKQ